MLYLKQDFDIQPASPETRDRFVELATSELVPATERCGARLVAAWFGYDAWFYRISHVLELSGFAAFEAFRKATRGDAAFQALQRQVEALAPERREELLEPLGPVPPEALERAIEASGEQPQDVYTCAILEVVPGEMERFSAMLGAAARALPIVASWRPVAGHPELVIDLWQGNLEQGYEPADERSKAFFGPLREIAPRERLVTCYPLPYSPLR